MASDNRQTDAELVESMRSFVSFRTPPTVFQVLMESADRLEHYHNEVSSVLELLDGLAEQWGDEAVFRRCRDRLRELVK
jgi:hypothetical protein